MRQIERWIERVIILIVFAALIIGACSGKNAEESHVDLQEYFENHTAVVHIAGKKYLAYYTRYPHSSEKRLILLGE